MKIKSIVCTALRIAFALAIGMSASIQPRTALAAGPITINITSFPDDPADGQCDIWEAMQAIFMANYNGSAYTYHECSANSGANTIQFNVSGAIKMKTGAQALPPGMRTDLPFVHGDTTFLGPVTFEGDGIEADTHIFRLASDAKLTLINVTVQKGMGSGSASAIYSPDFGSINLINSTIKDNFSESSGGAMYANGPVNIIGTTFTNNWTRNGNGGAIAYSGTDGMQISLSTFSNNKAGAQGGAMNISGQAIVTVTDTKLDTNVGDTGAIFLDNNTFLTLQRVELTANSAITTNGGGLYSNSGSNATLIDTQFVLNTAMQGNGGAIYNMGALTVTRSSFIQNSAVISYGGALANNNNGVVRLANVTFNGNSANNNDGGAIYNYNSSNATNSRIIMRNVTFSDNSSASSGAVFNAPNQTVLAANTVFEKGSGSANCNTTITTLNNNLDSDGTCGLNGDADLSGMSAQLLPPALNGGNLLTLLTQNMNPGSAAIDAGSNANCADPTVANQDETGAVRPKDGLNSGTPVCDIGAMEAIALKPIFSSTPQPPGPINFGNIQTGQTGPGSLTVQNAGNYTLTLSAPNENSADFSVSTAFPINIGPGGSTVINLNCAPTTVSLKTATFSFNTNDLTRSNVSYNLTCNAVAQPAPIFMPVTAGPIEFGSIQQKKTFTKTVSVQNTGTTTLTVTFAGFSGDTSDIHYQMISPAKLGINATLIITTTCRPSVLGLRSATLQVGSNDPSTSTYNYVINCTGIAPPSPYLAYRQWLGPNGFASFPPTYTAPYGTAMSPDGLHLYATGGGNQTANSQIAVAKHTNAGTFYGDWAAGDTRPDLAAPRGIAVSPDGNYVFATGFISGTLVDYTRDAASGKITRQAVFRNGIGGVTGISGAWEVAFSPDSKFAYVTGYNSNAVGIFKRNANATWSFSTSIASTLYSTHTLEGATAIAISPDGNNVYVSGLTSSATGGVLAVYSRNAVTGALTPIQTRWQNDIQETPSCFIFCLVLDGIEKPYHIAVSPDGKNVYVVGMASNALVVFTRDAATGKIHWHQTLFNNTGDVKGLGGAAGVVVSPDGKRVYTTGTTDNALSVFDRDPTTGSLTFHEVHVTNTAPEYAVLGTPYQVSVSPDGQWVFASAWSDNKVAVFGQANPIPALISLVPASAAAGSADFTLKVNGAGFVSGSKVHWGAFTAPTTYVNSTVVNAAIPAAWVTSAGAKTISVVSPTPGGGTSMNTLTFTVSGVGVTPVPGIDHLTPGAEVVGAASTKVDVFGANFVNGSQVLINGIATPATFIDSTHLTVTLAANTMTQPGTINFRVRNMPSTDSNEIGMGVAAPGVNVVPDITGMTPPKVFSQGPASPQFTIVITGFNFVDGATAQWNGSDRPTLFQNSTHVKVTINGSDIIAAGLAELTVTNPAPGGGTSNVLSFAIATQYFVYAPLVRR